MKSKPPFEITPAVLALVAKIERLLGQVDASTAARPEPRLRKQNRIRTIKDSLAIEGNTLSLEQVTALFENKRVVGPKREILEVQNAIPGGHPKPATCGHLKTGQYDQLS